MKKTIEDLQRMLIADQFIVTGSYALSQYGLTKDSDVKDLDIILVKPTEGTLELVKSLMTKHPAKTHPPKEVKNVDLSDLIGDLEEPILKKPISAVVGEAKNKLGLIAIFIWNGHKVDIFVKNEEPYVVINDVKYARIPNIVKAKKSCNRVKDWIQLRTICKFFFNKDDWERFLDTNPKISNSQEDYPF